MSSTYYDELGISPSSDFSEIKAAYRKMVFKYHPDTNPDYKNDSEKIRNLNLIYSILSDPKKRQWYDASIIEDIKDESKDYTHRQPYVNIYTDEVKIADSFGRQSSIREGDTIYYAVNIDNTIITWHYKRIEYYDVIIKHIFDPSKQSAYAQMINYDESKTPLFEVYWGNATMIIYQEDFKSFWISKKSFSKMDTKRGLITAAIVAALLISAVLYISSNFSVSSVKKEQLKSNMSEYAEYLETEAAFLRSEYYASDVEISYIMSDYYIACEQYITTTTMSFGVNNVPTDLGILQGNITSGQDVLVLLSCPSLGATKIKAGELIGWVPTSVLTIVDCESMYDVSSEY
ncbi:MAG: DnaJ domain-containing protein [Candidatus Marinimicrobia bacterium]|nr:DnaJ domain-containing protein [Candidatus Brocadiales bacterium]MBL7046712.1 DnaJ domain-containing protein [Candidatus Neomarinimicrobiota bacterium]